MLVATVTLTNDQIKALPTTPFEIIAAPGANKIIFPLAAWLRVNWVADYGNIDVNTDLQFQVGGNLLLSILEGANSSITSLLAGGGPDGSNAFTTSQIFSRSTGAAAYTIGAGMAGFYDSDVANKPLQVLAANTGDFTGGNAGNTLKISVYYVVVDF